MEVMYDWENGDAQLSISCFVLPRLALQEEDDLEFEEKHEKQQEDVFDSDFDDDVSAKREPRRNFATKARTIGTKGQETCPASTARCSWTLSVASQRGAAVL